jgi:hypothetical protein
MPALGEGPQSPHRAPAPGLENTVYRGLELPVIHLQLFQVCHQAKDSTLILRLAALKIGDGGDRTK